MMAFMRLTGWAYWAPRSTRPGGLVVQFLVVVLLAQAGWHGRDRSGFARMLPRCARWLRSAVEHSHSTMSLNGSRPRSGRGFAFRKSAGWRWRTPAPGAMPVAEYRARAPAQRGAARWPGAPVCLSHADRLAQPWNAADGTWRPRAGREPAWRYCASELPKIAPIISPIFWCARGAGRAVPWSGGGTSHEGGAEVAG